MPYRRFATYTVVGGAGWVMAMLGCGYFLGRVIPEPRCAH
jgi:membrane protein DedA with SNARE-associated domain